jgi:MerR family redox-sensitive transcriptional activator SoxR
MIAQGLGFSIGEVRRRLTALPAGRTPTQQDWSRISQDFRSELDDRIATLQRLRARLDGCIGCGCLSLKKCALYNPEDRARRHGPGPHFVLSDVVA